MMLLLFLALSAPTLLLTQTVDLEFGETIDTSSVLSVPAHSLTVGPSPRINDFEIISGGGSTEDGLFLQIAVPLPQQNDTSKEHSIFVIDFQPFTATSNPIVNDTIDSSLLSNCSNIAEPTTLASYFNTDIDTEASVSATTAVPFFAVELGVDKRTLLYTFDGTYNRFKSCETGRDGGMWIPSSEGRTTEYSTMLVVNNIFVAVGSSTDNRTVYTTSYRASTFILTWAISQYIFVETLVSSQKRVSVELAYTSLYPVIEKETRVTRDMILNIGFKTSLHGAFTNSNMMKYESSTASLVLDGVSIDASSTNPHPRCLETFGEDYCKQIWDFTLTVPDTYFGTRELSGSFFFRLELVRCDDLEGDLNLCAAQSEGLGEEIQATVTLDNIVEVRSDKETGLKLRVVSLGDPSGQADFLYGSDSRIARGIYHRENVEIWLAPVQNYPLITEHGLELVAFIVCIDSRIPAGAKRGCLEAEKEDRYIAYLADDLEIHLHGRYYRREDFEDPKQELTQNMWFPSKQQYQIGFQNLALSSRTRVYKITMLFKIPYSSREKRFAMVHLLKRSVADVQMSNDGSSGDGSDDSGEVSVDVNVPMGGCPPGKTYSKWDEPCSGAMRRSVSAFGLLALLAVLHLAL